MLRTAALAALALLLSGCKAPVAPRTFTIDAADYAATFDHARETLRDYEFRVARVDARSGVIATQPKPTAGFATPHHREQQTLGQDWQDFVNDQLREVRIWFRPADPDPHPDADTARGPALRAEDDLRAATGPIEATIDVTILRRRYPGRQVETEHIGANGIWFSRRLAERQLYPGVTTPLRKDDHFAAALAVEITSRLDESKTQASAEVAEVRQSK